MFECLSLGLMVGERVPGTNRILSPEDLGFGVLSVLDVERHLHGEKGNQARFEPHPYSGEGMPQWTNDYSCELSSDEVMELLTGWERNRPSHSFVDHNRQLPTSASFTNDKSLICQGYPSHTPDHAYTVHPPVCNHTVHISTHLYFPDHV